MSETKTNGDRLPPHAHEAEQGTLGCVLADGAMMNALLEKRAGAEWFYDLRHQNIFKAMQDLHSRRDVPIDVITVQQRLKDDGCLERTIAR